MAGEENPVAEAEPVPGRLGLGAIGPFARHDEPSVRPRGGDDRHRLEQLRDALAVEELGDRDDQRPVACEARESRLEWLGLERHDPVVDDDGAVAGAEPPRDRGLGLADAEDTGRERHQRALDALVGEPRRRRRAAVVERIAMRGVDERRPRPGGAGEPGGDPCLGAVGMDHVRRERAVGASDGPDRGGEGGRRGARDRGRQERHREVRPLSGRPADRDLVAALLKLGGEDADVAEGPPRARPEDLKDPCHLPGLSGPRRARRGGGPAPHRGRRRRSSAAAAGGSSPGSER